MKARQKIMPIKTLSYCYYSSIS